MKGLTVAVALLALAAPSHAQTPPASPGHQEHEAATRSTRTVFPASLAGRWTSAPFELTLTSDFHRSVYGPGARSTRMVTLTIQPSGEGVFTVRSSVRDRKGAVVAGTQEIEEARFTVGDLVEETGRQPHYSTRITHAERRFADDPASTFARDGVKLALYVKEGAPGSIEVRFDTPEGTGSFWETVKKTAARTTKS
jgi:hypothetical protein